MPTSVPGTCSARPRAAGFTLVEMLVVLLVMGLCVALVSIVVQPDDRAMLRVEADRLSELLDLAATEARLTGQEIAWTADAGGYRFWRSKDGGAWLEVRDVDALRARSLPQGVAVTGFRVESLSPQGPIRLQFPPQGMTLAYSIVLASGGERYLVEGSPIGEVRVKPGTQGSVGEAPAP